MAILPIDKREQWLRELSSNPKSTDMKCRDENNGDEQGVRRGIGHSFKNYGMVQRLN